MFLVRQGPLGIPHLAQVGAAFREFWPSVSRGARRGFFRSRPGKPKKGPKRKVHEFRPFLCRFWCFFLRKTSTIHIELLFRNAPVKSSWTDLSLVWFAGATPEFWSWIFEWISPPDIFRPFSVFGHAHKVSKSVTNPSLSIGNTGQKIRHKIRRKSRRIHHKIRHSHQKNPPQCHSAETCALENLGNSRRMRPQPPAPKLSLFSGDGFSSGERKFSPKCFWQKFLFPPLGSWTSVPSGHGYPHRNACVSRIWRAWQKFLPPDVRRDIRVDVRGISGPKTHSLGCFFVPDLGEFRHCCVRCRATWRSWPFRNINQ